MVSATGRESSLFGGDLSLGALGGAGPLAGGWSLEGMLGRLVELTGDGGLSLGLGLIQQAQSRGGLAAWVGLGMSSFYPPDFAAAGVDLAALAVVRVADARQAWRACDTLLRSGGFVLVIVDVNGGMNLPLSAQMRLCGLAQRHGTALIVLTQERRREERRSSLVSLRAATYKRRAGHDCFVCGAFAVKEKRGVPGWRHEEFCRGTDGLC